MMQSDYAEEFEELLKNHQLSEAENRLYALEDQRGAYHRLRRLLVLSCYLEKDNERAGRQLKPLIQAMDRHEYFTRPVSCIFVIAGQHYDSLGDSVAAEEMYSKALLDHTVMMGDLPVATPEIMHSLETREAANLSAAIEAMFSGSNYAPKLAISFFEKAISVNSRSFWSNLYYASYLWPQGPKQHGKALRLLRSARATAPREYREFLDQKIQRWEYISTHMAQATD